MSRGLVPTARDLEKSQHASSDSTDRPIGTIIATLEKKKAVETQKTIRPSVAR